MKETSEKIQISKDRLDYLERLEKEAELIKLKDLLPHKYLHKLYPWQREFFNCTERLSWLCAANQIGKSAAQIIKMITLATEPILWKTYFPQRRPTTFFYFYPSLKLATKEWNEKWVKIYMPKGDMKKDPQYGWDEDIRQKEIHSVKFNSGVTIYFMSYSMDASDMQAMTIDYVACDEELPEELYPELSARILATDGMLSCAFTATLGQEWMRKIIEGEGKERIFSNSWRKQISMYDCQTYEDGEITKFTDSFIEKFKQMLPNETEIQRRVYGKFVVAGGLVYPTFIRNEHFTESHPIPKDWDIYAGVDMGSGGESNHPAAICFIGVNPERSKARTIDSWRGDDQITTATDILNKYKQMRSSRHIFSAGYDPAGTGADFGTIVERRGEEFPEFRKAKKANREQGIDLVNVLFKNGMLKIYRAGDNSKLVEELVCLKIETHKQKAKDDLIDAMKYALLEIPFDFIHLNLDKPAPDKTESYKGLDWRQIYTKKLQEGISSEIAMKEAKDVDGSDTLDNPIDSIIGEIDDWNDMY